MKTQKNNSNNLATPGKAMFQKKFTSMIKEAEKVNFCQLRNLKFALKHGDYKERSS